MRVNQIKVGSFLSYLQMALSVLINLIYTPIMIKKLGQSEYGLYQTTISTITMLSVLSLGFDAGYIRYFSKYKSKNKKTEIYKLNGLYLIIFSVIGLIGCMCGVFLTTHLQLIFSNGLTQGEYTIAKSLMALQTVRLTIMFPMSVFQSIISANEKFIVLKIIGMLQTIGCPLLSIPLLFGGFRSIALVVVTLFVLFITDILYFYYVIFCLKEKFVFHGFEKGIFKDIFTYTSFIAVNLIVDQINMNVDKVLLGRYKGTSATAIYSVGFTIYQLYQMFSSSISSVFTPRIHGIVNTRKDNSLKLNKELTDIFIKVGRIQFLVLGLISSGIIFFGKQFIVQYWAGDGYEEAYYVALLLVLPATIALIQNLGIEIQRAENKHQFRAIIYLLMAVVNLILSIYLCQLYGAIGSAIGTAISLILANGVIMNVFYHKKCGIDIKEFWKNIIAMSRGLIIPACVGMAIIKFIPTNNIIGFLMAVVLYTLIYAYSVWRFSMNSYEKNLLSKPLDIFVGKILKKS